MVDGGRKWSNVRREIHDSPTLRNSVWPRLAMDDMIGVSGSHLPTNHRSHGGFYASGKNDFIFDTRLSLYTHVVRSIYNRNATCNSRALCRIN